jgi:hypothetical protein
MDLHDDRGNTPTRPVEEGLEHWSDSHGGTCLACDRNINGWACDCLLFLSELWSVFTSNLEN